MQGYSHDDHTEICVSDLNVTGNTVFREYNVVEVKEECINSLQFDQNDEHRRPATKDIIMKALSYDRATEDIESVAHSTPAMHYKYDHLLQDKRSDPDENGRLRTINSFEDGEQSMNITCGSNVAEYDAYEMD